MKLFEPMSIGTMTLRNRMVMPAMATVLSETNGMVSEEMIAYYSRRAAGGVALVTLEVTGVHRLARHRQRAVMIDRDDRIEGIGRLARSVQAHGAKFAVQLWHSGHIADPAVLGEPAVAPSPIPGPGRKEPPRALTEDEIQELVECFAEGARRAKEAGCDAVEIHCAHGYLIAQFLSPLLNKRTDRYGGELRNRARFALEVTARVREKVGPGFPVMAKLAASDHRDGGLTVEDTKLVAGWLEEAGVDALLVSSGGRFAPMWTVQPMMFPRGCLVPFAEAVKSVVKVPVGTVGRINNPALANSVLEEGKADFVALGRALIADPDFPRKAQEGRDNEIRSCVACRFCMDRTKRSLQCMVNPEAGRELELVEEKAREPRRVLVVGAGPAGMEAASSAARRGHRVTLCERSDSLGGMVAIGSEPPSKSELKTLVGYYAVELERQGVDVRLGQEVTPETVRQMAPDVVVAATGSTAIVPSVPGAQQENVVQARDVLAGRVATGRSAVVVGGGSVGCETAEYLRTKGVEVTVVEMLGEFARDMEVVSREVFLPHLESLGVTLLPNFRVARISGQRVVCANAQGREIDVEGETVVLAVGARSDTRLAKELKSQGVPVVAVGDCVEPRRINDAIYEGRLAGMQI